MGEESWPLGDYGESSDSSQESYSSGSYQESDASKDIGCSGDSDYMPWRGKYAGKSYDEPKHESLEAKLPRRMPVQQIIGLVLAPIVAYTALWGAITAYRYVKSPGETTLSSVIDKYGYPWNLRKFWGD